jgi:thiol:disulfide interchange protein DsbD
MSEMRRTLPFFLLSLLLWGAAASAATNPATNMPTTGGINAVLKANAANSEPEFLPPDQAFQVVAFADGPDRVKVQWAIHEGYYLYKSRIKVATGSQEAQLGTPTLPKGTPKHDDYFGDQEVYHDSLEATVSIARKAGSGKLTLPLEVTYQGCAEAGLCYPPITKTLEVALGAPVAASATPSDGAGSASGGGFVSKQDYLADLVKNGNILALLGVFFLGGLVLSFTPCVLPMVPILSGLIVGQGSTLTPMRGFSLAFTYVQGMALTYAAAGAIFAAFFKQAPQGFFQQPWIIGLFCVLFIVLAFAMFGAFTLQLPSALQTRLTNVSNNQKSGTFAGVLIMGALSALIVTACVAPAMVAALSVISQSQSVGRGAAALYATGLGMGAPLLLVGASAGSLLPRVGPWMDTVKAVFGTMFLGVAIYFGQQLVPPTVGLLLWAALAVIAGFWVLSWKARDGSLAPAAVRAPGLIAVVYGILLLIGVASGAKDPLEPLSELRASRGGATTEGTALTGAVAQSSGLNFETIKTVDELEARVAAASAAGKPVMLDFYADWCASCKEMERYTFTDSSVQAALSNAVLLRADVTRNDAADQALLKHFGIFGPPTIAFYDPAGQEQRRFRVVGYMKAPEFASVLQQALSGGKPI